MTDVQTIEVTAPAGAIEPTWPMRFTELTGRNISAATVEMAIGSAYEPSTTWAAATVQTSGTSVSPAGLTLYWIEAQLRIDSGTAPGVYYVWMRLHDGAWYAPRRGGKLVVV